MENNNTVKISHTICNLGLLKIRLAYERIIHLEFSRAMEFHREIISILVTHFPFNEKAHIIFIK